MNVMILNHTNDPDRLCGQAAAICTGYTGDPVQALRGALKSGHESVAEHASFTFAIEGVSRVLLAQITRHRLASFSVQSQRYVSYESGFGYIVPPKIEALGDEAGSAALPRFGVVEVFGPRLHAITIRVKGSGTLWSSSAPHREIKEYKEIGGIIMNPT